MSSYNNMKSSAGGTHLSKEEINYRLSKRLCYILRYGAVKSGLHVSENGFVDLQELIKLPMLRWHSEEEILTELKTSISVRNVNRFEVLQQTNSILVRAVYARNFEKKTSLFECEEKDSLVESLYESCLQKIINNLDDYDLTDFQDEHIIRTMIYRLKIQKKLNIKKLRVLLVPTIEHLDMEGLYLTENIIKLMCKNCPNIKDLSLKDCGYIITDSILVQILKKLPQLQCLNLAFCNHLTDKSFDAIVKHAPNIQELNLNKIKNFSQEAVFKFIPLCNNLEKLEIYNVKLTEDGRKDMIQLARTRRLKVTFRGIENLDINPEQPAYL